MKSTKIAVNQQPLDEIDKHNLNKVSSESDNKDLENLLKPFGGNEKFYRRLLKVFEANLDQQLTNLEQMILQNNTKELMIIVHTLKGTSGTAGLTSIYQTLCAWEIKLKDANSTNAFEILCVDLVPQLRSVTQAELSKIHALLAEKEIEAQRITVDYSIAELTAMLAELKQHLENNNLEAVNIILILQNILANNLLVKHELTVLYDAVEMLDFDNALVALSSLSNKL
ncbi:Hpt domain-containing protein [Shewanella sp. SG41-4]|uniref:Hpt domain-containing protein n=1 Tax=Shewanella sp. SG41-4 TaxID=2760976 RepID=UPI0015FFDB86|nr:Hpt domain-containing protein [Shewanella sp. SG41-4]MBB1438856.1 Hpt domain-containing protein [Shewanella sp. SG41-4]